MDIKNVQPLGSRVLIKPYEAAKTTSSGLIQENQNNASSSAVCGTIIAIGDKSKCQVGQMILFRRYSIDELKIVTEEGEQVVSLVDDEEVLALINNQHANEETA